MKNSNDYHLKELIDDLFALGDLHALRKLRNSILGHLALEELHPIDQDLVLQIDTLVG